MTKTTKIIKRTKVNTNRVTPQPMKRIPKKKKSDKCQFLIRAELYEVSKLLTQNYEFPKKTNKL